MAAEAPTVGEGDEEAERHIEESYGLLDRAASPALIRSRSYAPSLTA